MDKKDYPKICIASFVQRANDLAFICYQDKPELQKAGLQWETVEQVAKLVKVCAKADANWRIEKRAMVRATEEHRAYIKECRKLRSRLAENIRGSMRQAGKKIVLSKLSWNNGIAVIIQDLNDLAVISERLRGYLVNYNFDFDLAYQAACKSKELAKASANLILQRNTLRSTYLEPRNLLIKELRNKMKEICFYARKAFSGAPQRRVNYYIKK